jgi:hypothetical protein
MANFQINIPQAEVQLQPIPPETSPKFVRTPSRFHLRSTLARHMLNIVFGKSNHPTKTNWKLSINYVTQY